jgi:hypothetical protein
MNDARIAEVFAGLTAHALVIVLRAETLEQLDRLGVRLRALHGAVGHVDGGLAAAIDLLHVGALRHEVENHLVVAA